MNYSRNLNGLYFYFLYNNHLGSASLELDENADIISYEEYHPFGTSSYRSGRTETEVSLKRHKYVGKERDDETGLYYYGARYYAAWLGRFVSVDPMAGKFPFYTPYQYSGNNPVTFYDLDGNEQVDNIKTNVEQNGQQKESSKINMKEYIQENPIQADATRVADPSRINPPVIDDEYKNPVKFDLEIGQANITPPFVGVEGSVMTIETGYQNTIWRNNWIAISSLSTSGGVSIGLNESKGEMEFPNLDPWANLPVTIANAQIKELSISVGAPINYINQSGEGFNEGKSIFNYETHGIGVGYGFPINYSESLETMDVKFGWPPHEIDTIINSLNNPSHPISDSIIKSKGLNIKNRIDSLKNCNIDFRYHVNKDSLNKALGNENSFIKDFFNN